MTQAKVFVRSNGPEYKRKAWRWPTLLSSAGLILFTLVYLLPLFYTVATSLKTPLEIAQDPLGFPKTPRFENYFEAASKMNYLRAVLNTVFITAFSSAGIILLATLAAYPLARVRARWTSAVYQYFAFGLTIPALFHLLLHQFRAEHSRRTRGSVGARRLLTAANVLVCGAAAATSGGGYGGHVRDPEHLERLFVAANLSV